MKGLLLAALLATPAAAQEMRYEDCIAKLSQALEMNEEVAGFWLRITADDRASQDLIRDASAIFFLLDQAANNLAIFCEELRQP